MADRLGNDAAKGAGRRSGADEAWGPAGRDDFERVTLSTDIDGPLVTPADFCTGFAQPASGMSVTTAMMPRNLISAYRTFTKRPSAVCRSASTSSRLVTESGTVWVNSSISRSVVSGVFR